MDIEFEVPSEIEALADNILESSDIEKIETTRDSVNIRVKTFAGRLVIKRFIKTDKVAIEAVI